MPSISRRRKAYDQQVRALQNRNLFAGLFLLAAAIAAVVLVIYLSLNTRPEVYVSINRIDHQGTHTVPFSLESCQKIEVAFDRLIDYHRTTTDREDLKKYDLDSKKSNLQLGFSSEPGDDDILIVYLNGDLSDQTPVGDSDCPVSWYGADETHPALPFSDLLKQVADSTAKTKVVLLDAGRHSSSAVFPGRPDNRFQSTLASELKQRRLGDLDLTGQDDLWIITSHSDHEISHVSTPLQRSIFAAAIIDTIETLSTNRDAHDTLTVSQLFEDIHRRTTSWSRNFKEQSIQHPVLMRVGQGIVSTGAGSSSSASQDDPMDGSLLLAWNRSGAAESDEEDEAGIEFQWQQFASPKDAEELADQLFDSYAFSAAPFELVASLEMFLELGQRRELVRDASVENYLRELADSPRPSAGYRFSRDSLSTKQDALLKFRRSVAGLALLNRFRNELRYWDDQKFDQVRNVRARSPVSLSLADATIVQDQTTGNQLAPWQQFHSQFQSYLEAHRELFENVQQTQSRANEGNELTLLQAELIGRAAQRYLPLLQQASNRSLTDAESGVSEDDGRTSTGGAVGKPKLRLAVNDRVSPFKLESTDAAVATSLAWKEESNRLRPFEAITGLTDTDYRFSVAAWGSERLAPIVGKVPNIKWARIKPEIVVTTDGSPYFVNPFEMNPIELPVEVHAVQDVEFQIFAENGVDDRQLDFGFDRRFEKSLKFRNEDQLRVFVRHRAPASHFGKTFDFRIDGYSLKNRQQTWTFPFQVVLTADPGLELIVDRALATVTGDHSTCSPLIRWDSQPGDRLTPLTIRTLANVKSGFRFSIINRLGTTQEVQAKLFHVLKTPPEIDSVSLNADRFNTNSLANFVRWLEKSTAKQLDDPQFFQLLAVSPKLALVPNQGGQTAPQPLQFSPAPRPDADEESAAEMISEEVRSGLLMLVYKQDQPEIPEWYQWVRFEPRDSANSINQSLGAEIKPLEDIQKVFGSRISMERLAAAGRWDDDEEKMLERASSVSTVSQNNFGNGIDPVDLEGVFRGELLTPASDSPALFLVDVLGVPGYRLLRTSGGRIVDAETWKNNLTGIRLSLPAGKPWVAYPDSWSLISSERVPGPFDWLNEKDQKVYVKFPAEVDREDVIDLELFLPMQNAHPLDGGEIDFQLDWRGSIQTLRYPTARRHFIELPTDGIVCWSEVRSHHKRLDRDDLRTLEGQELTIFRIRSGDDGNRQRLGSWTFVTQSERRRPRVVLSNTKVAANDPESLKFTIDTSQINPPVPPEKIELMLEGEAVENAGEFLKSFEMDGRGDQFQFNLKHLTDAMGLPVEPGNLRLKVTTTDFFGQPRSDNTTFTVFKPAPPSKDQQSPPPPKPIDIELVFEDAEKQPVDVNEFESLTINGTAVAWGDNVLINGRSVWAARKYDERGNPRDMIKVYGLPPDVYSFAVTARVSGKGDLSASADADFKASPSRVVTISFN